MKIAGIFPTLGLCLTAMSVAGCVGGGGGGGAGGGGGGGAGDPDAYSANLRDVQGRVPTSDMPVSGTARYSGQVQVDVSSGASGGPNGTLTGGLALEIDFQPANSDPDTFADNVSGTADNFVLDDASGRSAVGGTLTAGLGEVPAVATATESSIDTGTPAGTVTVRTGATSVSYGGELDFSESGGPSGAQVVLGTGGNFVGPDGQGAWGSATLVGRTDPSVGAPNITGSGDWYILRD